MSIQRIGTTARWSDAVVHNGTVYLVDVPTLVDVDIQAQARELLGSVEATLQQVGSSKAALLMATIYLDDIRDLPAFNQVWDAWVPPGTAPARACVQTRLGKPGMKVEIQVIAATTASPA